MLCVCVSIGAWAQPSLSNGVTCNENTSLSTYDPTSTFMATPVSGKRVLTVTGTLTSAEQLATLCSELSTYAASNEIRLLDMRGITLQGIDNPTFSFSGKFVSVVLPYGLNDVKASWFSGCTSTLYAAVSYNTGKTQLRAYVNKPGTLKNTFVDMSQAGNHDLGRAWEWNGLCGLANGDRQNGVGRTLTDIKLSGYLNSIDLGGDADSNTNSNYVDNDGHIAFASESKEEQADSRAYSSEAHQVCGALESLGNITRLDLTDAYFEVVTDMTISRYNIYSNLKYLLLPTDSRMTTIPAFMLNGNFALTEICIPSNYTTIKCKAFAKTNGGIDHIWTTGTDPFTVYDNGAVTEADSNNKATKTHTGYAADGETVKWGTYTFSSNIQLIESYAFGSTHSHVKDVYVLATEAPECHVNAFNTKMYVGNNSYNYTIVGGIIDRDCYMGGETYGWITMLHYPRETTTPNTQRYQDQTREYTIATNLRDGKGGTIYFPTQAQFIKSYDQATHGYLWNAWADEIGNSEVTTAPTWTAGNQDEANKKYNSYYTSSGGANTKEVFYQTAYDGQTTVTPTNVADYTTLDRNGVFYNSEGKDYRGWHQFVLTATAKNSTIDEEPYRSYITDNEWWTICPTFDITQAESAILFGTAQGVHTSSPSQYPFVSKLRYVRRTHFNHTITLNFSVNLTKFMENRIGDNNHAEVDNMGVMTVLADHSFNGDEVVMKAGVPYLIKPCLPANAVRQFRIFSNQNEINNFIAQLGQATFNEKNGKEFIAVVNENLYNKIQASQRLNGDQQRAMVEAGVYTVPVFVSENHGNENVGSVLYSLEGSNYYKSEDWKYSFVGSWYNSKLPQYSYFLGWDGNLNGGNGGARFYYNDAPSEYMQNNPTWANETGIILPIPANRFTNGFPYNISEATSFNDPAQWKISDLSDDSYTVSGTSSKTYNMVFDDEILFDSEATGIRVVNTGSSIAEDSQKVFTLDGQLVGYSLNGLPKGIYVVNGKKYVVK